MFESRYNAICGALEEVIEENDIDLSEAVKQKIREAVGEEDGD